MKKIIPLTINDLIDELDKLVEDKIQLIIHATNLFSCSLDENEDIWEVKLSSLKEDIYLKLNNISLYNPKGKEDYEKIAKIIANTHDIVERAIQKKVRLTDIQKSFEKLPNYIQKYFVPFEKFNDIKKIDMEASFKFDGEGSFINYATGEMGKIYVQATATENILDQTELIFKTSEKDESKKVYVISENYPKEHLQTYFKEVDSILYENLEILRFLILSSKIHGNKVFNKNTSLDYFFSIIFFSSKGFDNNFNKEMYKLYYTGEFNTLNLLEQTTIKNKNRIHAIEKYLENIFRYFNKNLKIESFQKDCANTEPMEDILNHLYGLVKHNLENNKERNILATKLKQIDTNFTSSTKLPSEENKRKTTFKIKKIFSEFYIQKNINYFYMELQKNKTINYNFDYIGFINKLEFVYIEECKLKNIKEYEENFNKLSDEDVLNIVYYNNGTNFTKLSYEYKERKEKNNISYDETKKFKKFVIERLIIIFNNLTLKHVQVLNKIFTQTVFSSKGLKLTLLSACFEIANKTASDDYINNFKIYLLSRIFYPQTLNNDNYPKITNHILDYGLSYNLLSEDKIKKFINLYDRYRKYRKATELINEFNFSICDLYNLLKILNQKNEYHQLKIYIELKLQELLIDGRAILMQENIHINKCYQKYRLIKVYSTDNVLNDKFYEKIHEELINLNILVFHIEKNDKIIAIILAHPNEKDIVYNIEYIDKGYTHNEIEEICNSIIK